jgi:hypothetical protein
VLVADGGQPAGIDETAVAVQRKGSLGVGGEVDRVLDCSNVATPVRT